MVHQHSLGKYINISSSVVTFPSLAFSSCLSFIRPPVLMKEISFLDNQSKSLYLKILKLVQFVILLVSFDLIYKYLR